MIFYFKRNRDYFVANVTARVCVVLTLIYFVDPDQRSSTHARIYSPHQVQTDQYTVIKQSNETSTIIFNA